VESVENTTDNSQKTITISLKAFVEHCNQSETRPDEFNAMP
jgi:hypothetical protein